MILVFSFAFWLGCVGERSGRGIVTDAITTPVVNTTAYFFDNTAQLIDFKVCKLRFFFNTVAISPASFICKNFLKRLMDFFLMYFISWIGLMRL